MSSLYSFIILSQAETIGVLSSQNEAEQGQRQIYTKLVLGQLCLQSFARIDSAVHDKIVLRWKTSKYPERAAFKYSAGLTAAVDVWCGKLKLILQRTLSMGDL